MENQDGRCAHQAFASKIEMMTTSLYIETVRGIGYKFTDRKG